MKTLARSAHYRLGADLSTPDLTGPVLLLVNELLAAECYEHLDPVSRVDVRVDGPEPLSLGLAVCPNCLRAVGYVCARFAALTGWDVRAVAAGRHRAAEVSGRGGGS